MGAKELQNLHDKDRRLNIVAFAAFFIIGLGIGIGIGVMYCLFNH
jgi:hypothetical protein